MTRTSGTALYATFALLPCLAFALSDVVQIPMPTLEGFSPLAPFPLNSTQIYNFQQVMGLDGRPETFDVNYSGRPVFRITKQYSDSHFKVQVTLADSSEITVNSKGVGWPFAIPNLCDYKKTLKASNGVQFKVYPDKPEHWRIKKGGIIPENYFWYRKPHSLSGPITTTNGTKVAYLQETKFDIYCGYRGWQNQMANHQILSTGALPAEVLVTFYQTAITRWRMCGY